MRLSETPPATPFTRARRIGLNDMLALIERRLRTLVSQGEDGSSDRLAQAVRYTLLAPGKRLRPLLTMLVARELGLDVHRVVDLGCAVEMVHAASLALDDLPAMDDAAARRGQPATHVVYGEDVAILASITLLSRAYATVSEAESVAPAIRCRLVGSLARAVGSEGLAGGQYRDLRPRERGGLAENIADANHLKTGMLFVAAVEMAALAAEADPDRLDRLRRFAGHFGQAFQLLDDLADGPDGRVGSEPCEDAGKATLVSVLGRQEVARRLGLHLSHALEELSPAGELAAFVLALFDAHLHPRLGAGMATGVAAVAGG